MIYEMAFPPDLEDHLVLEEWVVLDASSRSLDLDGLRAFPRTTISRATSNKVIVQMIARGYGRCGHCSFPLRAVTSRATSQKVIVQMVAWGYGSCGICGHCPCPLLFGQSEHATLTSDPSVVVDDVLGKVVEFFFGHCVCISSFLGAFSMIDFLFL
jgi:hypothetical protein